MPDRVRRGLGLLAVGALGLLAVAAAQGNNTENIAAASLQVIGGLVALVGLVGGLGLIAWGLLVGHQR